MNCISPPQSKHVVYDFRSDRRRFHVGRVDRSTNTGNNENHGSKETRRRTILRLSVRDHVDMFMPAVHAVIYTDIDTPFSPHRNVSNAVDRVL